MEYSARDTARLVLPLLIILILLNSCGKDDPTPSDPATLLVGQWTMFSVEHEFEVDSVTLVDWYQTELGFTLQESQELAALAEPAPFEYEGIMKFKDDNSFTNTVTPIFYFFFFTFSPTSIGTTMALDGFPVVGTWAFSADDSELILTSNTNQTINFRRSALNADRLILGFVETQIVDMKGDGGQNEVEVTIQFVLSRVQE